MSKGVKNVGVENGKLKIKEHASQPKYIPYIVSEKLDGIELAKYKPTHGVKDIKILRSLMDALIRKYTYFKDINLNNIGCHKDLHPGNIFVIEHDDSLYVKLIDFYLSVIDERLILHLWTFKPPII